MKKIAVESSALSNVGYDIPSKTLYVEFTSGSIYRYASVPAKVILAMLLSSSVGKYFSSYIRTVYEFKEVKEWPEI